MKAKELGEIYDDFPDSGKNMPRVQFIREALEVMDPRKMARDLDGIQKHKALMRAKNIRTSVN